MLLTLLCVKIIESPNLRRRCLMLPASNPRRPSVERHPLISALMDSRMPVLTCIVISQEHAALPD
eukprot:6199002-Pleurochrysis_carterae.AAC.3